jgi:hypothetical protein
MKAEIEVPLPSGIFCKIRPVRFIDKLIAYHAKMPDLEPGTIFTLVLMSRCCTFDGEVWTVEQIADMEPQDGDTVSGHLLKYMSGPIQGSTPS